MLPMMSWRYNLASTPMDAVKASTESAVFAAKRPPQSFFLVVFNFVTDSLLPKDAKDSGGSNKDFSLRSK